MEVKADKSKNLNISISERLYNEILETLPANISIEMLINKLLRAWKQEPSSKELDKDTKEERIALLKSAKETCIKKNKGNAKIKKKKKNNP